MDYFGKIVVLGVGQIFQVTQILWSADCFFVLY